MSASKRAEELIDLVAETNYRCASNVGRPEWPTAFLASVDAEMDLARYIADLESRVAPAPQPHYVEISPAELTALSNSAFHPPCACSKPTGAAKVAPPFHFEEC